MAGQTYHARNGSGPRQNGRANGSPGQPVCTPHEDRPPEQVHEHAFCKRNVLDGSGLVKLVPHERHDTID